jgi:hypothetical protein
MSKEIIVAGSLGGFVATAALLRMVTLTAIGEDKRFIPNYFTKDTEGFLTLAAVGLAGLLLMASMHLYWTVRKGDVESEAALNNKQRNALIMFSALMLILAVAGTVAIFMQDDHSQLLKKAAPSTCVAGILSCLLYFYLKGKSSSNDVQPGVFTDNADKLLRLSGLLLVLAGLGLIYGDVNINSRALTSATASLMLTGGVTITGNLMTRNAYPSSRNKYHPIP